MNPELLNLAEQPWNRFKKVAKFESKYNFYPPQETTQIVNEFEKISDQIPNSLTPSNLDEVYQNELKRKLEQESLRIKIVLRGARPSYEDVLKAHAIDQEDLTYLKGWLLDNRKQAQEAVERVYKLTDVEDFELNVPYDQPGVRRQVEEVSLSYVENYHQKLGRMIEKISSVGSFLRNIKATVTTKDRSYFSPMYHALAISIGDICAYSPDRTIHPKSRRLISIYGHEGQGHALHTVMTKNSQLPFFLNDLSGSFGTAESIAQFYEKIIFDDLLNDTDTQKSLGISHNFKDFYQEEHDTSLISEYSNNQFRYGITVLADKSHGDPKDLVTIRKKIEILSEVGLLPTFATSFVYTHQDRYDPDGNLSSELVRELIYAARPVDRVLDIFTKKGINFSGVGRSLIDETILTGYWTPKGLVEKATVIAK